MELYCNRFRNSLRRKGREAEFSQDKCLDKLERFCRKRCRKGRSLTGKCEMLNSRRPDWRQSCESEREVKTSEEETTDRWSRNKSFKKTWKTVRVKKATPAAIKRYNDLGRRIVSRDQRSADRAYRSITSRTLPKPKDPRRRVEPNEMSINNLSEHFEGDMDKTVAQLEADEEELLQRLRPAGRRKKRKVARSGVYAHWPQGRPISYHFADNFVAATKPLVRDAIKFWEENTCIRFQENGPETNRLEFANGGGCSSYVGMVGGTQEVSIRTPGCDKFGIVCHEIGHALGFFHEQARPNRDENVQVMLNNVNFWYQNNFAKMQDSDVEPSAASLKYDFGSVMHYDAFSFATNQNMPTIRPRKGKEGYQETMGQRQRPSFVDVAQVNAVYCASKCSAAQKAACKNGGYPNPNNCARCHCPDGLGGAFCDIPEPSTSCPGAGQLAAYNSANKQTLATPNFGGRGRFGKDTECVWMLTTRPGYKIHVEAVENFDLDCKAVCDENFMEVKMGVDLRPTGARYCCDYMPFETVQVSEGHIVLIIMRNKAKESHGGFKLRYWTNDGAAVPTGVVTPRPTTSTTTRRTTRATTRGQIDGGGGGGDGGGGGSGPGPGPGCTCGDWSAWSGCSEQCGGCGRIQRSRSCTPSSRRCYRVEKRICNRRPCPKGFEIFDKFSLGFQGGQLTLDGCCGSLQSDGFCGPLNLREILKTFVGGSRTTSSAGSGGNILGSLLGGSGTNPLGSFTSFFNNRG